MNECGSIHKQHELTELELGAATQRDRSSGRGVFLRCSVGNDCDSERVFFAGGVHGAIRLALSSV